MIVRAVAFDFDGVLVDSERAKRQAYDDVFALYPDHATALALLRGTYPSANRVEFFTRALAETFGRPDDVEMLERLMRQLSGAMVRRVTSCPAARHAARLWAAWPGATRDIVSLTPQDDLRGIVAARGYEIDREHVFGCPPFPKPAALRAIITRERIAPRALMVVGDQPSDADAARDVGAQFTMVEYRSTLVSA